jgi:dTDP-4-amino-4,6-dideoxygalactose transaminase
LNVFLAVTGAPIGDGYADCAQRIRPWNVTNGNSDPVKNRPPRGPVPLLDLPAQYADIEAEVRLAIDRVIESQQFILGPEVEALENEVAGYCACRFGIGVSSGTDALLASLMALGIGAGDEVITTPYTFFATAGSISRLGARPVFADIDALTYNIDPAKIEAAITARTRAIIPVHLYGQMADMDPIMEIARRYELFVIEDAAQAIGAEYQGRRAGSIGDLGCLSFFPSKNLGAFGDGGMVVSNNPALAEQIRILRSHGSTPKYYHKIVGGNFRLDAIQAAILRVKLKYLDLWTAARQKNAAHYRRLFAEAHLAAGSRSIDSQAGAVGLPHEAHSVKHSYNQFVIRVGDNRRRGLVEHLTQQGIGCEIYYPVALHQQACFEPLAYRAGDFPESEAAARRTVALPIYPELTESLQATVVTAVAEYFNL